MIVIITYCKLQLYVHLIFQNLSINILQMIINNTNTFKNTRQISKRLSKLVKVKLQKRMRTKLAHKLNQKSINQQAKNVINKQSSQLQQNEIPYQQKLQNDNLSSQQLHPLGEQQKKSNLDASWYFSGKKFQQCQLSEPTKKALKDHNYTTLTHIQSRTLPYLLKGRDVLGAAKTGSGKTLAYLIPCFQLLYRFQFNQRNGTGAIIITPTRQLALQVFQVAKKLGTYHNKTIGLLIGGMNRKNQSVKLEKGVNILICTPGRLLDHLQNSKFIYHNLLSLVIDEADALLKIGFEEQLTQILKALPKQRQTVLFSATQTRKVQDLAKLSLKQPIYIGVDDTAENATVENLQQGFVVIEAEKKFKLLFTFLQKQKDKKIMIFFSSCNEVKFFSDLLNYVDISVMDIHGKQKQQKRSTTFYEFNQLKKGILLCTDVAARGLDIPEVDWIIQYDPPLDIKQYIHRVGRTCRGVDARGRALLFLIEQQRKYLKHLLQAKVQLNQYQFQQAQLVQIQNQYQLLIEKNHYLATQATSAFKSYLHAYTTYGLKQVFNVHQLDLKKVACSFGLKKAPHVDLNIKIGGKNRKKLLNNQGKYYKEEGK